MDTLSLRSPLDVVNAAPRLLGFQPVDSFVGLTFGPVRTPHFRIDMPHTDEAVAETRQALAGLAVHDIQRSMLLFYTDDVEYMQRTTAEVVDLLNPIECIRVWDGYYYIGDDEEGAPVTDGPLAGELAQRQPVVRGSREALEFIGEATDWFKSMLKLNLFGLEYLVRNAATHGIDLEVAERGACRANQYWIWDRCRQVDNLLSVDEIARLLAAIRKGPVDVRDTAVAAAQAAPGRAGVAFWRHVVETTMELSADLAAIYALSAYTFGDGASAWVGVDLARTIEPEHALAGSIAAMVANALDPNTIPVFEFDESLVVLR